MHTCICTVHAYTGSSAGTISSSCMQVRVHMCNLVVIRGNTNTCTTRNNEIMYVQLFLSCDYNDLQDIVVHRCDHTFRSCMYGNWKGVMQQNQV